jgi:peptidoglycan/xylan/chitin deacetylase (PgdA/CDA1 family)
LNIRAIIWLVFMVAALAAPAADVADTGVRVARFKGDREAAFSFTLDDGWEDNATLAALLFDRYGIHATFFLVPGTIPLKDNEKGTHKYGQISWGRWKQIVQAGHEIGNHGLQHRGLTKLDDAAACAEIAGGRQLISEKIGVTPVSFAYPGNGRDDRVRKFVYAQHAVAREFESAYGGEKFTTEKANGMVASAFQQKRWMVAMLHAITNGYAAFPNAGILEEHLKYIQPLQDRLWVDTFGNVGRYVKERDAAKLEVKREATSATLTLTTGLDASLFNVPLTVVIEHVAAASAEARREGAAAPLPVTIAADRLLVEVVPGTAPVTIRWQPKQSPPKS